ncbi:MAG TPA: DUF805 domain-containing protein [Sphingomonas sp.]|nr:DUF805 domain-containing protein [Sphingomonas sp.]
MEWMTLPLKRYAEFGGRSRRKEYWMFFLLMIILGVIAGTIDTVLGFGTTSRSITGTGYSFGWATHNGPVEIVLWLATLIPSLSVTIRRLHDLDKSGWWLLILLVPLIGAIVLLVFMCIEGTRGTNRFGSDPLAGERADIPDAFR